MPLKDPAARKAYAKAQYEKNKDKFIARSKARRLRLQAEKALLPKPEKQPVPCYSCGASREDADFPTRGNKCKKCLSVYNAAYRAKNSERISQYKKKWVQVNRNKKAMQDKRWAETNRERSNAHKKRWNKANAGVKLALDRKYKASKAKRAPAWLDSADHAEMEFTYIWCNALRSCGLDYHVDHIIPLQGKVVSGLHVPWNLQVIPAAENLSKHNRWDNA